MRKNINIPLNLIEELSQALIESVGHNAPYPTADEIASHKRRADHSLKYQNLTLTNDANQSI